jgi:hypothetical protein
MDIDQMKSLTKKEAAALERALEKDKPDSFGRKVIIKNALLAKNKIPLVMPSALNWYPKSKKLVDRLARKV